MHTVFRRKASVVGCAFALVLGSSAFGMTSSQAAPANDPFGCATSNPVVAPVGLPPGTTFWMHNGFNGTFSSSASLNHRVRLGQRTPRLECWARPRPAAS